MKTIAGMSICKNCGKLVIICPFCNETHHVTAYKKLNQIDVAILSDGCIGNTQVLDLPLSDLRAIEDDLLTHCPRSGYKRIQEVIN